MNYSILNYGFKAEHKTITVLEALESSATVSDFDAFLFDPNRPNTSLSGIAFHKKCREIRDLIHRKGGIVICLVRKNRRITLDGGESVSAYSFLEPASQDVINLLTHSITDGVGTKWELVKSAKGPSREWFLGLNGSFDFEAYLVTDDAAVLARRGTTFARNSVDFPLAVEFQVGAGRICFVPVPNTGITKGQLGSAVVRVVESHFGCPGDLEEPTWVRGISVPGANSNDDRADELARKRQEIEKELSELLLQKSELEQYRVLLFGTGKSALEPVVRRALRELGYKVLSPTEHQGEWDVDLTDPVNNLSAVGEIEGSEGQISVNKFRQLLDYVEAEEDAGRKRKGILIGNGFRLKAPGDPERLRQFTDKAMNRAEAYNYCLMPTTELYKAVCSVLECPTEEKEALKSAIRNSIFSKVGVWEFQSNIVSIGYTASTSDGKN